MTRGRPKTCGSCANREELERNVHWFYSHTELSMDQIGRRFKVSQRTVCNILDTPRKEIDINPEKGLPSEP